MAPRQQLPALSEDLLEEIFLRIACPAALARASAASVAFRRLITDRTFLRRYRTRHPPLLLGFFDLSVSKGFHPVEAPHPNAPAARALAKSCFDYLPPDKLEHWHIRDVREGRVLIECSDHDDPVLPDFAVCDPFSRRYLMLPRIPLCEDQEELDLDEVDVLFAPSAEEDHDETSFRVIGAMRYVRKLVVLVFDSAASGSWTVSTSARWDDLSLSNGIDVCPFLCLPSYAYGSFYWKVIEMNKLLKLDITRWELTTLDLPSNHYKGQFVVVVEAAEGRLGIFSCTADRKFLNYYSYNNMQNQDRRADKWQMKNSIPLPVLFNLRFFGAQHGYIFIKSTPNVRNSKDTACYSLDINTLKLERVIQISSRYCFGQPYFSFPLSMSPTI